MVFYLSLFKEAHWLEPGMAYQYGGLLAVCLLPRIICFRPEAVVGWVEQPGSAFGRKQPCNVSSPVEKKME
jgi:hypothetical protein